MSMFIPPEGAMQFELAADSSDLGGGVVWVFPEKKFNYPGCKTKDHGTVFRVFRFQSGGRELKRRVNRQIGATDSCVCECYGRIIE